MDCGLCLGFDRKWKVDMILEFDKDYYLENEMVKLEPLQAKHRQYLETLAKAPEIWTFFDEGGTNSNEIRTYLLAAQDQRLKGIQYPFVAYDKRSKNFGGMTRLYAYDPILKNIKLGHTWFGKKFQGTGLNKASKHCILKFAFEELSVERVGFGVHEQNSRSIGAMKSIGISYEGALRNFLIDINGNSRSDLLLYGITKKEWNDTINGSLKKQILTYL